MESEHPSKFTNLDICIDSLSSGKLPTEPQLKELCSKAIQILAVEPNVVELRAPITICGDVHGQLPDLVELFRVGGDLPATRYLFLGNYVDRGRESVQTFCLLLALKIKWKECITLLRGNHECTHISRIYGLYDECRKHYGRTSTWRCLTEVFNYLPVAAVVEGTIFCVHSGLSMHMNSLDDIRAIDRICDIEDTDLLRDLLWTEPSDERGWNLFGRGDITFGPVLEVHMQDITRKFLHANELKRMYRGHQLVSDGYANIHQNKLVTVFSAPNYCYRSGNTAAIVKIDQQLSCSYVQFETVVHE